MAARGLWGVALLLSLVVVSVIADDCLDESVAVKAVSGASKLGTSVLVLGQQATTSSAAATVFQNFAPVAARRTSPYFQNLNLAYANNNIYIVARCYAFFPDCGNRLIYLMRNDAIYDSSTDEYQHLVVFLSIADVANGTVWRVTPTTYQTNTTFWYVTGSSGTTQFVSSPVNGLNKVSKVYVNGANANSYYGAVWASERSNAEPCDFCLQQIAVVNAVQFAAASNDLDVAVNATSIPSTQRAASANLLLYLLSTINDNGAEIYSLYYGTDNATFYQVSDCLYLSSVACSKRSSKSRYVFSVTDSLSSSNFISYECDDYKIGSTAIYTTVAYNPTTSTWYRVKTGWTDYYDAPLAAGAYTRTFTSQFNGGVVGGDVSPSYIESLCVATTDSSSHKISATMASLAAVLMAALWF